MMIILLLLAIAATASTTYLITSHYHTKEINAWVKSFQNIMASASSLIQEIEKLEKIHKKEQKLRKSYSPIVKDLTQKSIKERDANRRNKTR